MKNPIMSIAINMKTTTLLICLFAGFTSYSQDLSGGWKWVSTNTLNETEITLQKVSYNEYKGDYCSAFDRGNKLDCYDEPFFCITIKRISSTVFKGEIKSNFDGSVGVISVVITNNNNLEIKIIDEPQGEYYFPSNGTFSRI